MRADLFVSQKLNISRNKASEMIEKALVLVDNKPIKPSFIVDENTKLEIIGEVYVSRAAYKLKGLLEECSLNLKNSKCLDVGSSTGGFCQILLENGALSVDCVDVGTDQLHQSLRDNPKINLYENTDIRTFQSEIKYDFVLVDVSFISIYEILTPLLSFAKSHLIILFKPQFEVGKEAKRDKKGVVKDTKLIEKKLISFESFMLTQNLDLIHKSKSKILGKEGNAEYFFVFKSR